MSTRELSRRVGIVAIGRNEGERLRRCLDSLGGHELQVVYVDSDSTDGSPELARERGVETVALDLSRPFTAARARNEGFARLMELAPELEFVFFVDGDCEVRLEFLEEAVGWMSRRRDVAVVCGRRRERYPDRTIYNRLADMEWDTPVGEADACGGDALMRVSLFREERGYDASLVSGEEPELCLRFRRRGFKVLRIDADMTVHDADMKRLGQWWNRALRTGHAAAERLLMYGLRENPVHLRRARSAAFWAVGFPLGLLATLPFQPFWLPGEVTFALILLGYLSLWTKIYTYRRRRGDRASHSAWYGLFCILGKYPELCGMWSAYWKRRRGVAAQWIEYKDVEPVAIEPAPELVAHQPARRKSA